MTTRIAWLVTAVLCFAAAATAAAQTPGAPRWQIYQNDRYGTTIDYPDIFKAEPPPDNDDGQRFKSADGAEFAVFASYNAFDFDIAGYQPVSYTHLDVYKRQVFACLAALLFIAAIAVTQLGPEARQKSLDEIAPPTG